MGKPSSEEINTLCVSSPDFEDAITSVQISSTREILLSITATMWDDVGGLQSLRKEFENYIVQRIKNPEDYKELGIDKADGFLLFGPPGCGKTLIARAVANNAGANFIHIEGPELLYESVGESELAIRMLFTRARTYSPCIILFDELDELVAQREQDGGQVVQGVVNQLLIELERGDDNQGVYIIGTTNRPELIYDALLRPGKFGKRIYVGLPNADERCMILKALARSRPIAADVDLDAIARSHDCSDLSGADLAALMTKACIAALVESMNTRSPLVIQKSHFETALKTIVPSVKNEERAHYKDLARRYQT